MANYRLVQDHLHNRKEKQMAYTKQTWNCGDEITAEKLNHIEDGIENAGGVLTPLY